MKCADQFRAVSTMVTMTNSKSDSDLARKMGMIPSNLCNVRYGRVPIRMVFMYRFACLIELPMSKIKEKLGVS